MPKHTTPRTCQHNPLQHRRTIHACDIARRGYNCFFHHSTRFHRIHAVGLGVSLKVPDTTLATASCKIQVSKRLNTCPSCSLSDEMRTATQPSILPTCLVRALGGRAMHRYTDNGAPLPPPSVVQSCRPQKGPQHALQQRQRHCVSEHQAQLAVRQDGRLAVAREFAQQVVVVIAL